MKSLLVSIIVALSTVIAVVVAGEAYDMHITMTRAFASTYWLTIPTILVGIMSCVFGDKQD